MFFNRLNFLVDLDLVLRHLAILLEFNCFVRLFFHFSSAWRAALLRPSKQTVYLQIYFQYFLKYRLLGISCFIFDKENPWPKPLLFTDRAIHRLLNVISVLKIILRRLNRSMTNVFQNSTDILGHI